LNVEAVKDERHSKIENGLEKLLQSSNEKKIKKKKNR
jgi:hypothetical protein